MIDHTIIQPPEKKMRIVLVFDSAALSDAQHDKK